MHKQSKRTLFDVTEANSDQDKYADSGQNVEEDVQKKQLTSFHTHHGALATGTTTNRRSPQPVQKQ